MEGRVWEVFFLGGVWGGGVGGGPWDTRINVYYWCR